MNKEELVDLLKEINSVYKDNDWLEVKKYILKSVSPEIRKNFSKRDYLSKKHIINEYEKNIINIYYKNFNILLELKKEKIHKKSLWQRNKNEYKKMDT